MHSEPGKTVQFTWSSLRGRWLEGKPFLYTCKMSSIVYLVFESVGSFVGNPFDVLKTLSQANKGKSVPLATLVGEMYQNQGIGGFYRGVEVNIMRACILNATKMGVYDLTKGVRWSISQMVPLALTIPIYSGLTTCLFRFSLYFDLSMLPNILAGVAVMSEPPSPVHLWLVSSWLVQLVQQITWEPASWTSPQTRRFTMDLLIVWSRPWETMVFSVFGEVLFPFGLDLHPRQLCSCWLLNSCTECVVWNQSRPEIRFLL